MFKFHVDCFSQTEPTQRFRLLELHVSSPQPRLGSRYLTMLLGSDLSQPTSTSNVQIFAHYHVFHATMCRLLHIISPASFLVLRGFRSIQPGGLASIWRRENVASKRIIRSTVSWLAYLCSSSALRNLSEPPTLTLIIPL